MRRHRSSAVPLAWLYAALILYASLYPFAGWRMPGSSPLAFLLTPWNRWWSPFDVAANFLGYMPLGLLVFVASLRGGRPALGSFALAAALGGGLSLGMETLQNLLPSRVPSTIDLATNLLGAVGGALLGLGAHVLGGVGRWQLLRQRWFVERSAGGIALLLSWPVALLFPAPLPFGVGQGLGELRALLAEWAQGTSAEPWFDEALRAEPSWVALSAATETVAVAFGLLAPVAVAAVITPPGWRRAVLVLAVAAGGVGATTLSTAMNFGPQHALAWLNPTAVAGVALATALAAGIVWAPSRVAAALGLAVVAALVALVAQAPADPYFAQSLQGWEQGRFIRFHGAAQWVGWLWPYAALVYLLACAAERNPR